MATVNNNFCWTCASMTWLGRMPRGIATPADIGATPAATIYINASNGWWLCLTCNAHICRTCSLSGRCCSGAVMRDLSTVLFKGDA